MEKVLKDKLLNIVELVDKNMADPDIDIEYCIPEVETTVDSCDVTAEPYILIKYAEDKYTQRKVRLSEKHLRYDTDTIVGLVAFSIEQFKSEVDALQRGE